MRASLAASRQLRCEQSRVSQTPFQPFSLYLRTLLRVGVIHIDEIDKIAKRGGSDVGGSGRDVGGEGVQQALLRLLEGTSLTLSAKAPAISSSTHNPSVSSFPPVPPGVGPGNPSNTPKASSRAVSGDPPGWESNNSSNKGPGGKRSVREGLPGYSSNGGGTPGLSTTKYPVRSMADPMQLKVTLSLSILLIFFLFCLGHSLAWNKLSTAALARV